MITTMLGKTTCFALGVWQLTASSLVLALLVVGCAQSKSRPPTSNAQPTVREVPIPLELRDQIRHSSEIGRQLYLLDKVAAIGTDVLLENVKDIEAAGIAGYLPMREGDGHGKPKDSWLVSFFTSEAPPRIAYEVRVAFHGKPTLEAFNPPKPSKAGFALLAHARELAISAVPRTGQPINPVLLPAEANGEHGILVYLLAGTTKPDVAVFGKHFRVLVSGDGSTVQYAKPLSNTALELPTRAPEGAELAALMVTQVVTDFPLETHVFTSLLTKKLLYVGTRRGIWRVDGERISLLAEDSTP